MPTPCTTSDTEATCMGTSIGQAIEREIEMKTKRDLVTEWESPLHNYNTDQVANGGQSLCFGPIRNCRDACSILKFRFNIWLVNNHIPIPMFLSFQSFKQSRKLNNNKIIKIIKSKKQTIHSHILFLYFLFLIKGMSSDSRWFLLKKVQVLLRFLKDIIWFCLKVESTWRCCWKRFLNSYKAWVWMWGHLRNT